MASAAIHISVANEINKKLKMNNDLVLLGSVAPDLAKLLGETKDKGHFLFGTKANPNLSYFKQKYGIDKSFLMGYYIHLYTDLFWFRDIIPNHYKNKLLYLNNNKYIDIPFQERLKIIYKDYSSLNRLLINKYKLNLSFLDKTYTLDTKIEELDITQIHLLTNEIKKLIDESIEYPLEVFTEEEINKFIKYCTNEILKEVKK